MAESEKDRYFRMGAVVAVGELYAEGALGDGEEVRENLRKFLKSFGVRGADDVLDLISFSGYREDFRSIFPDMPEFYD